MSRARVTMAETADRRPLSTRAKLIVGGGALVAAALVLATSVLLVRSRVQARRVSETRATLERLAIAIRRRVATGWDFRGAPLPEAPIDPAVDGLFKRDHDDTGQRALCVFLTLQDDYAGDLAPPLRAARVLDAWGRPVLFRYPGVVHNPGHYLPAGWDLYSLGPNGIDEKGQGDDILVGEDVAAVATGR